MRIGIGTGKVEPSRARGALASSWPIADPGASEAHVTDRLTRTELAWLLAQPVVTAPIIGPRTLDQLSGALRALELKLTPETLGEYLRETEGRWFRLLDFEARFQVNKKTAWGYLNLLLQEGVLTHNGEKANRVRYALAAPFQANPASPPGA